MIALTTDRLAVDLPGEIVELSLTGAVLQRMPFDGEAVSLRDEGGRLAPCASEVVYQWRDGAPTAVDPGRECDPLPSADTAPMQRATRCRSSGAAASSRWTGPPGPCGGRAGPRSPAG